MFPLVVVGIVTLSLSGCGLLPQDQVVGVWRQPDEHLVGSAPCGVHCRSYQGYEVVWNVPYPQNLKLANFRLDCRNIGDGYPCLYDTEISIDDDTIRHTAKIYWRNQSSACAVRLVADEIQ
jgi:hypothetical protein